MDNLLKADIICKAGMQRKKHPFLRKGQSIFIEASVIDKNKAFDFSSTEYDCFYDDSKIEAFLNKFCE